MNKAFRKSELYGAIFAVIFGTLSHFFYEWSGRNPIAGIFSPYNESVWEHLKLLFFPVLFYSAFQYFHIGRNFHGFMTGKLLGILTGMLFIVVIFYLYSSIVGHSVMWIDISLFFLGVALCFGISYIFTINNRCPWYIDLISAILLLVIFLCFYIFTFFPPDLTLFRSP